MKKNCLIAAMGLLCSGFYAYGEEVDYTSRIVNPSFETNGLSGWTSNGFQSQTNNSPHDEGGWEKDGNVYAEKWVYTDQILTDCSLYQEVNGLPNGDYVIRAVGHAINQTGTPAKPKGVYLYSFTDSIAVEDSRAFEVTGTVAEGKLLIGFGTKSTDANWVAVDNFRIFRTGESTENYRKYLDKVVEQLTPLFNEEDRPAEYNKDEIDTALANAASATTDEEIIAAIAALRTAEANYKEIKAAYIESQYVISRMKSEINIAELFYEDSDYEGKDTFRTAIDAAKAVLASGKTEDYDNAIAALREASAAYKANRPSEWVRIKNGAMWKDSDGKDVQAHAAGFVQLNDRYYMIGEDRTQQWNPDVNMYSSKDLVNWRFERKIIENGVTHPDLGTSRMIERPKILYNAKTGRFVVWCHWEAGNYGASEAGVFYSDTINAPYKFHSGSRPMGIKSRDCNVYVDDNGTAYFISTTSENTNLGLFRLSDDYLTPVEHTSLFNGQRREAPAIVKHEGRYYMLSSACSGWDPNTCKLSYTDNLTSGWSGLSDVGNKIAYDTQAASILKVEGSKATTYLYVGDRWQDPGLPESKTIIFPISFTKTGCEFKYVPEFEINFATGEWRAVSDDNYADKTRWQVIDYSSEETKSESSAAVNVIDGNTGTKWHTNYSGPKGTAPHYITVDMGAESEIAGFVAAPRTDKDTNGLIRNYTFEVSDDGNNWTLVSAGSWMPYWGEVTFPKVNARYFKLSVLSGEHASMSEIDILKTSEAYEPATLRPYYQIGSDDWTEGKEIKIGKGDTVKLGPGADNNYGSWSVVLPDGTVKGGREYTLENFDESKAGRYRSHFLDMYNHTHTLDYNISLDDNSAVTQISDASGSVVSREYFSLSGVKVSEKTLLPGIYICREYLSDKSVREIKLMVR